MTIFLTVLHIIVCILIIIVVLLQRGKGAEIGAVFGGGSSSTVFGSRGAGNFLTKITTGAAVLFMLTSLSLAYFAKESVSDNLFESEPREVETDQESSPFSSPLGEEVSGDSGLPVFEEISPNPPPPGDTER